MSTDSLVGAELGRSYRMIRLLAEGGSSLIYEAERLRPPRRKVAVKVMHQVLAGDQEMIARFHHEAEVLGELQHYHVVELIDVGQTDEDLPFHVMELLDGETLRERLDRDARLPPEQVAELVSQAASALQALHDLKVVHRDVSPRNLFLVGKPDDELQVKLMDFSLAMPTGGECKRGQPEVIGSEGYMSPEQFRGEVHEVDATTDIFALAVVAYEALSGRRPFDAEDEDELLRQVCKTDPTPVTARVKGLPPQVNGVLARALAKKKGERHDNIEAFARELSGALDGAAITTPSTVVEAPPVSREPEPAPEPVTAPAEEQPEQALSPDAPTPETGDLDPLDGMTLMDATPPPMEHRQPAGPHEDESDTPGPEEVGEQAGGQLSQDPSLAGQTLVGEDDLLEELFGAGDDPPPAEAAKPRAGEPGTSPLDRHTVMLPGDEPEPKPDDEGQGEDEPPERHTLVLPEDAPKPRSDKSSAMEPATAGQTLVGEDDLLDELAGAGARPASDAVDPLDGQTIMDEVMEVEAEEGEDVPTTKAPATTPPDVGEPPPLVQPRTGSQGAEKIVTVFQGDAWAKAEEMATKRSQPKPTATEDEESREDMESTLDIDKPAPRRVPLVAVTIAVVVILALVLYFLSR